MPKVGLGFLIVVLGLGGCSPRFVRLTKPQLINNYLEKISAYNAQVNQIKAAVDIRGHGLVGQMFHERADLVVQKPQFLLWSLRSFFDSPASIVASNGEFITMYDFSGHSAQRYQKIELKNNSVIDFLDFRFHPPSLIAILLAQVPLEGAYNISLAKAEDIIEWSLDLSDSWQVRGLFDSAAQTLLESSYTNPEQGLFYHVKYAEPSLREGILFPSLYLIRARGPSHTLRFDMRIIHSELNGPLLSPEMFYLKPT